MLPLNIVLIFLGLAALLCIAGATETPDIGPLFRACKSKLATIKSVDQMREFLVLLEKYRIQNEDTGEKLMKRCMAEYDSLLELRSVLDAEPSIDVCHPSRIEVIVNYHRKQLTSRHSVSKNKSKKRMVRHFMRRYGLQVALICRRNLLANIKEAQDALGDNIFMEIFPWRRLKLESAAHNKKSLVKTNETEQMVGALEEAELLFASIVSVDQIIALMRTGVSSNVAGEQQNVVIDKLIHDDHSIGILREGCRQMANYYKGAIMSIVSLASVGYAWQGYKMNEYANADQNERRLISDWLSATIICDPLLAHTPESMSQTSSIDQYHVFSKNRLESSEPFNITQEFVDEFAMSKSQIFVDKWSYKLTKSVVKMSKPLKSGKYGAVNSMLGKVVASMQSISGDRVSKGDDRDAFKPLAITALIIAICAALMLGLFKMSGII